jgi:hypothetical protein
MSSIRATEQLRSPRTRPATFARCGATATEDARPGVILAVAERAIYDCTRRAGSQGAPQRNVMVMLSPLAAYYRYQCSSHLTPPGLTYEKN